MRTKMEVGDLRSVRGMVMFRSLRHGDYRQLWIITALANASTWAFTLAIGWQIYTLTHSSYWVGIGMVATLVPNIVGAPIAGVLADRMDRRYLIATSIFVAALTNAALTVTHLAHLSSVGLLIGMTLVLGMAMSVMGVALNSLLPNLVPKEDLFNAVSLQGAGQRGMEFVGPALASPLLAAFGVGAVFVFCFCLYMAAALCVFPVRRTESPLNSIRKGFFRPVAEGVRYIVRSKTIGVLIALVGLHCILTMAYMGVFPQFVEMELQGNVKFYGLLISLIGLGAIGGTLILANVTSERWRGELVWTAAVVSGLSLLFLGISRNHVSLVIAVLAVGCSQAMFMTLGQAYVQHEVDEQVRGRVTSVYTLLAAGGMSLGNWLYGAVGGVVQPHVILIVIGAMFVAVVAGFALWSESFRGICKRKNRDPIYVDPASFAEGS